MAGHGGCERKGRGRDCVKCTSFHCLGTDMSSQVFDALLIKIDPILIESDITF